MSATDRPAPESPSPRPRAGSHRLGAFTVRRRRAILVARPCCSSSSPAPSAAASSRGCPPAASTTPASPSAARRPAARRHASTPRPSDLVLIAGSPDGASVDSPAASPPAAPARRSGLAAEPGVRDVAELLGRAEPGAALAPTATMALITARLVESGDAGQERAGEIAAAYAGQPGDGVLEVHVSGAPVVFSEVGSTIEKDLARAESIAIPITMLLMLLVFGTLVAVRASRRHRRGRRPRLVPRAVPHHAGHRRQHLRHQPRHRARHRPRHRLRALHRHPLPRGARPR